MVEDGQRTDTRKDKVLSDFIGESFHGDKENIGRSNPDFIP